MRLHGTRWMVHAYPLISPMQTFSKSGVTAILNIMVKKEKPSSIRFNY